jgi:hypothetical protein
LASLAGPGSAQEQGASRGGLSHLGSREAPDRRTVCVLDFMEPSQVAGAQAGTFDVTPALKAALAHVLGHPYTKTLYVPRGIYKITEPIMAGPKVSVVGAGSGETIFQYFGTGFALVCSNPRECGGFSLVSNAAGQSGFQMRAGVGPIIRDLVIRDFDGVGFQLGDAEAAGGVYFANINYVQCTNERRTGRVGFLLDGRGRVNSNANVCVNVFVKGRWAIHFHVRGNTNILVGGDSEPHSTSPTETECYRFEGIGNRVISPYIEPIGGIFPAVVFRFTATAHSNRVSSVFWGSSNYATYSKIVDLGTNNDVEVGQIGPNYPSSPGKKANSQNLLRNAGFFNLGSDGLPVGWEKTGSGTVVRDQLRTRGSAFSMRLEVSGSAVTLQSVVAANQVRAGSSMRTESLAKFAKATVSVGVWCWSNQPGLGTVALSTGAPSVGSHPHSGSSAWEFLTASRRVDENSTAVVIQLRTDKDNARRTGVCYFSEPVVTIGNEIPQYPEPRPLADGDAAMAGRLTWSPPQQLALNSSTPSVAEGNLFTEANTEPTKITNLLHARSGQEIKILTTSSHTTLRNTAEIATTTGADKQLGANTVYKLIYSGTKWYEF